MIFKKDSAAGQNIIQDIFNYFLAKPSTDTLIKFSSRGEREIYSSRILQDLHVEVSDFQVLNIHKIGIDVPPVFIFEELLLWDEDSLYWPNQLARIRRVDNRLENILVYTLGIDKIVLPWFRPLKISLKPLFNLTAIKIKHAYEPLEADKAGYLLYSSSGGYPIGIFSLYVRDSITEQKETEMAQLYSVVAFNFYGKKNWFNTYILNPLWRKIHNRVSTNILNRIKITFEKQYKDLSNIRSISAVDF